MCLRGMILNRASKANRRLPLSEQGPVSNHSHTSLLWEALIKPLQNYSVCWRGAGAGSSSGPALRAQPSSAIHHQVERLFTAGVKVPDACLWALSDEPLLRKQTLRMQRPH